jgi:23S rRNA (cytidine1920-2'-O)/16S rRNA (cytidine1409-2'-O)-methyltransferase
LKARLDRILVSRNIAPDLGSARALIGAGQVYVNDEVADKAGQQYADDIEIRLKTRCPYVSRGGLKLEKGLTHFNISVENLVCVDIGASTGGFTDCLLQGGAKKIFAVDVAYGQLAWKLRQDPRVAVLERFNARNITSGDINDEKIDLAVIDASFISLEKLIPPVVALFRKEVIIIALIKPQFELPREDVGPGGVIADSELQQKAIRKVEDFIHRTGLYSRGTVVSPVQGPKGNFEFLICITNVR